MKNIGWPKKLYMDKFKRYLLIALIITGIFLLIKDYSLKQPYDGGLAIHFFYHPQCPHCNEQKPFNEILMEKYPKVTFFYHDVTKQEEAIFRLIPARAWTRLLRASSPLNRTGFLLHCNYPLS